MNPKDSKSNTKTGRGYGSRHSQNNRRGELYQPRNKNRNQNRNQQGGSLKFKNNKSVEPSYLNPDQVSYNFNDSLNQLLQEHLNTESVSKVEPNQHELEFRLGDYYTNPTSHYQQNFNPNLPRLKFNRIIRHLANKYPNARTESLQLDIIHDKTYRVTITTDDLSTSRNQIEYFCKTNRLKNTNNSTKYGEKVTILKNDNPDWHYRLSSCHESTITDKKTIEQVQRAIENKTVSKFYRYKYRYSFQPIPQVRIDCTIIKETPKGAEAGTLVQSRTLAQREKYQVELEYLPNTTQATKEDFDQNAIQDLVQPYLTQLVSLYTGTLQPISRSHSYLILQEYLKLSFEIPKVTIEEIESRPTSHKFLPMEVEALTRENYAEILKDYLVSQKADGEHFLLYTHPEHGVYLINNRLEVSPLSFTHKGKQTNTNQTNTDQNQQNNPLSVLKQTLLDGELTNEDGVQRFLIFDAFFYQDEDLRDFPLYNKQKDKFVLDNKTRFHYVKEFLKTIENLDIKFQSEADATDTQTNALFIIEEKQYFPISKASRFFQSSSDGRLQLKNDEFPYEIDGLVYTPARTSYPKATYQSGNFRKPHSLNHADIRPILKWKPPECLSIDFRVTFKHPHAKKTKINNQLYQIVVLESAYNNRIHPFEPSSYRFRDYNKLYLPVINNQPQITDPSKSEDSTTRSYFRSCQVDQSSVNHVVREKDILECVWVPTNQLGNDYYGMWIPIRYREDKTQNGYPNNYRKVADRTWLMIHDKPIRPENLADPYSKTTPSPQLNMGYYNPAIDDSRPQTENDRKDRSKMKELRTIHNSLKNILIFLSVKQAGNNNHRLLDMGSGCCGDLHKWRGLKYVFGIELDESNLKLGPNSAYTRYRDYIDRAYLNDRPPQLKLDLIQGDISKRLSDNRTSNESAFNHILKQRLTSPIQTNPTQTQFGVMSCQFSLHYICDSEEHIDNFFRNASQFLAPDGYLIATTFDGEKILTSLKASDQQDKNGRYYIESEDQTWRISTPTKYHKLEDYGQKIFVRNSTIKDEDEIEYLVNFKFLLQTAEKYGLFPSQLSFKRHTLPFDGYGIGSFQDLYQDTTKYLDLIGKTVILENTPRYQELKQSLNQIPKDDKRYSQFSSYLIFKKAP